MSRGVVEIEIKLHGHIRTVNDHAISAESNAGDAVQRYDLKLATQDENATLKAKV